MNLLQIRFAKTDGLSSAGLNLLISGLQDRDFFFINPADKEEANLMFEKIWDLAKDLNVDFVTIVGPGSLGVWIRGLAILCDAEVINLR